MQTLQGTKENRSSYKCKKDNSHNRDVTSINVFFRSKFKLFSEVWNSCCIFNSQLHVPAKLGRITVVHPNLQLCRTLHFLRLILKGNILSKTRVLHDSCDEKYGYQLSSQNSKSSRMQKPIFEAPHLSYAVFGAIFRLKFLKTVSSHLALNGKI